MCALQLYVYTLPTDVTAWQYAQWSANDRGPLFQRTLLGRKEEGTMAMVRHEFRKECGHIKDKGTMFPEPEPENADPEDAPRAAGDASSYAQGKGTGKALSWQKGSYAQGKVTGKALSWQTGSYAQGKGIGKSSAQGTGKALSWRKKDVQFQ